MENKPNTHTNLTPATQIWRLPDTSPYNRMLFSDKLTQHLLPSIKNSSASEVLTSLWRAYFYLSDHQRISTGDVIQICSEFGMICTQENSYDSVSFYSVTERISKP